MYYDYSQHFHSLQSYIQAQDQRITQLEKLVRQLAGDIQQLKTKPAIHVDTIEYKFDQLKVETVEGTLNIGINPSDLQGVEDLAIDSTAAGNSSNPKVQMQRSIEIEDEILRYLETDLPTIVINIQTGLNIEPNETYLSFIREDIKKQLPSRIDYHLKAIAQHERAAENLKITNEKIINQIKQEIYNGVQIFFQHLPESVKGMKQE